jgi:antirestriction protein
MEIKIYVSNLSKYASGSENGEWITLPASDETLTHVNNDIIGNGQEWIILDYNAPFSIGEYDSIEKLQNIVESINECGINETEVKALFKAGDTPQETLEHLINEEFTIINTDEIAEGWAISDQEEINGLVLNECGYVTMFDNPIPEELIDYINWEQIWTAESINCGWNEVTVDNTTFLIKF